MKKCNVIKFSEGKEINLNKKSIEVYISPIKFASAYTEIFIKT